MSREATGPQGAAGARHCRFMAFPNPFSENDNQWRQIGSAGQDGLEQDVRGDPPELTRLVLGDTNQVVQLLCNLIRLPLCPERFMSTTGAHKYLMSRRIKRADFIRLFRTSGRGRPNTQGEVWSRRVIWLG